MPRTSIPAVFREQVAKLMARPMVYGKRDRHWRPLTWAQMGERVLHAASGLCVLGVQPGDRVAILSDSGPEWVLADLAIQSAGGVCVPISVANTPNQVAWMLAHAECRIVFVHNRAQLEKLIALHDRLPVTHVVHLDERILEGDDAPDVPSALQALSLLELERMGVERGDPAEVDARVDALGEDDLLTIIYTSGTTGEPKGVMLSHGNVLANCQAVGRALSLSSEDVVLSFLPLSHAFERMAGNYMALLFCGATVYFAEGMGRLIHNMAEVRPTVMTGVPRVYEKIYARFMARRESAGPVRRRLADWALGVGRKMSRTRQAGRRPSRLLEAQYRIAADQVFDGLRDRLGGRIRFLVSGGAPLSAEIAAFFHAAGILILEGYGLTETSPVVSVNRIDRFRFGTVGRPLDNVRVRLDGDGEILVKGPSVMRGYFKDPEATARVLDADGWLRTGDIGTLERDGFLRITDRKKDLFKNAGGKYIAPQQLEGLLTSQPMVDQACVVGDRRPFCVALVVPEMENIEAWAREKGLDWRNHEDLMRLPTIHARIQRDIDAVNAELARHELVRAFWLLSTPFTEDNGQLTSTQKLRRKPILAQHAAAIEELYANAPRRRRSLRRAQRSMD